MNELIDLLIEIAVELTRQIGDNPNIPMAEHRQEIAKLANKFYSEKRREEESKEESWICLDELISFWIAENKIKTY